MLVSQRYARNFGNERREGMNDELAEMAMNRVEYIRSISGDPEVAHAQEKELWRSVLIQAAAGRNVEDAAIEALKTQYINFPRWFA